MFEVLVYGLIFFIIPATVLSIFAITLYRFKSAQKKNKACPGSFSEGEIKKRKIMLIVSSVITGVFVAMMIGICAIMYMAVAYM